MSLNDSELKPIKKLSLKDSIDLEKSSTRSRILAVDTQREPIQPAVQESAGASLRSILKNPSNIEARLDRF